MQDPESLAFLGFVEVAVTAGKPPEQEQSSKA